MGADAPDVRGGARAHRSGRRAAGGGGRRDPRRTGDGPGGARHRRPRVGAEAPSRDRGAARRHGRADLSRRVRRGRGRGPQRRSCKRVPRGTGPRRRPGGPGGPAPHRRADPPQLRGARRQARRTVGDPPRGSGGPDRHRHGTARRRRGHRPSERRRRHHADADGRDQRLLRPRGGAARARRRPQPGQRGGGRAALRRPQHALGAQGAASAARSSTNSSRRATWISCAPSSTPART